MFEYPKMKTLFKLEPLGLNGKKWDATNGEILADTSALHFLPIESLVFHEKIDGTNMGIQIDSGKVAHVQSRNKICVPGSQDQYYFEILEGIQERLEDIFKTQDVVIYGELSGPKIQKGGNYFKERHFLVFDILDLAEHKFFRWDAVAYFCDQLGLETVPTITYTYPNLSVGNVRSFVQELRSVYNPNHPAEGIVIRYKDDTTVEKRWQAKIRRSDFK